MNDTVNRAVMGDGNSRPKQTWLEYMVMRRASAGDQDLSLISYANYLLSNGLAS